MDQELKQEFNKIQEQFGKVNESIEKMSVFTMTRVVLKEDLKDLATKDDLQKVKSDIFDKVDGFAYRYKNLDEEKIATGNRLDKLEAKTGIV